MKRFILSFLILMLAFVFIGCSKTEDTSKKDEPTKETEVPTLSYDVKEKTLKVGESFTFEITENVGFAVANSKVLSLDKALKKVTALAAGETTVTIYLSDYPSVKVEVKFTVEEDFKTM